MEAETDRALLLVRGVFLAVEVDGVTSLVGERSRFPRLFFAVEGTATWLASSATDSAGTDVCEAEAEA